jgi:hypothetical protein
MKHDYELAAENNMKIATQSKFRTGARRFLVPVSELSFVGSPIRLLCNVRQRTSNAGTAVTNGGQESWRISVAIRRIRERMNTGFRSSEIDGLRPADPPHSWQVTVIEERSRLRRDLHGRHAQDFVAMEPHLFT